MASRVGLLVGGKSYEGWKAIRITRSMEALAGSFDLSVSDRFAGQEPWPIFEEDECKVAIDRETVIAGHIDRRAVAVSSYARGLSYSGRDAASALVDCSALLSKWTFRNATILDIAKKVAEPFGVAVGVQPGLTLPPAPRKLVVNPGDSPFNAIEAAARHTEVLVVSDGDGGIVLTRAGTDRADGIEEGQNLLGGSVDYDGTSRFYRYVVLTQTPGTDDASGSVTRVRAEATDEGVLRTSRVLLVRPESGVTTDYARRRGDWEARIRAARSVRVTAQVVGWRQPKSGELWPINALVNMHSPSLGVSGDLLIAEVTFELSDGGEITTLRLVRPDAFTPEPSAVVKKSGSAAFKELVKGAR